MIKNKSTTKIIQARLLTAILFCTFAILIIIGKYGFLSISHHEKYQLLAKNNFTKNKKTDPLRGLIFDRNFEVIAENKIFHKIHISKTSQPAEQIISLLEKHVEFDHAQFLKTYNSIDSPQSIVLDPVINTATYTALAIDQWQVPGLSFEEEILRYYPFGELTSHLLGYCSKAGQNDEVKTGLIGKIGIEKTFDERLRGTPGIDLIKKNARGKIETQAAIVPPLAGQDIQLTIDVKLQKGVQDIMQKYTGVAIIADVNSGEVLSAVSWPSFKPNMKLQTDNSHQNHFFNRLTHGLYPPASTVKPFIAIEALNLNLVKANTTINDPGYWDTPNHSHRYHDWLRSGHGKVNLRKAIAISCDTYFYQLAEKMGAYNLFHAMQNFSLGIKTGIELPGEKNGLIPSPDWKKQRGERWYLGDSINIGIGQGSTLVTPLQLTQATLLLASHGNAKQLHLLKAWQDENWQQFIPADYPPIIHSDEHWQQIDQALVDVISVGTGHRFKKNKHKVAGKTGTAQVVSMANQNDNVLKSQDHSLFIGYAPHNAPKIAVVVILEHNPLAVQVASDIVDLYFGANNG